MSNLFHLLKLALVLTLTVLTADCIAQNKELMFTEAVMKQDTAKVKAFLAEGINPNHVSSDRKIPLCVVHSVPAATALVAGGADINYVTPDGRSILDMDIKQILDASRFDNDMQHFFISKMKYLIEKGIKQEFIQEAYRTCLSHREWSRLSKIEALLVKYVK